MSVTLALRPAGERAVLVEVAGNHAARRLAAAVREAIGGLEEVVPGHETVLLRWEHGRRPPGDLAARLRGLLEGGAPPPAGSLIELPVVYDGPDLPAVAAHAGVSVEELVRRHAAAAYVAGFVGFAPGFAYLLGGDPALRPPRLERPRERVPAGALAIAGEYTAVYPSASPGGWNLVGRALVAPLDLRRERPVLIEPGARVRLRIDGAPR